MKEVKAVIQPHRLDAVLYALHQLGNLPIVVQDSVQAIDTSQDLYRHHQLMKIELMVPDARADEVVKAIQDAAHTGNLGDGRIFVIPIEDAVLIRTGERGEDAR